MVAGLCPALLRAGLWLSCVVIVSESQSQNIRELDRQSTCGSKLTVYESPELTLVARSNVAPANPPLECIVYLESGYQKSDGRSRLQIIVEQLTIDDCNVKLAIFNGHGASGNYLRLLGCSSSSTDIIYTKDRTATVRFTRPLHLYQTAYDLTLTVKAYEDGDQIGTEVGVDSLGVGAIIGIVIGLLVVIAIAILLGWCCCTGYIHKFLGRDGGKEKVSGPVTVTRSADPYTGGSIDSNMEKVAVDGLRWEGPAVWGSVTGNGHEANRNFRQGVPRKAVVRGYTNPQDSVPYLRDRGGAADRNYHYGNDGARDSHVYEPYDDESRVDRSPRFRKRSEDPRAGRGSHRGRNTADRETEGRLGGGKETVIDDPGSQSSEEEGKKKPLEDDLGETDSTTTLDREGSQVAVDTIVSPMHVNAAVRASVPDLSEQSPEVTADPSPSPRGRRKPGARGRDPDPMGLPPEAFDPVFTTPTSQEQYPGEWRPAQPLPMPFLPYGMVPLVPGQQTYAYAYQTAPQVGSYPGQQGAYFMQSVPTAEGDVQKTAFAMRSERTPRGQNKGRPTHPGSPEFSSTPEGKGQADPSPVQSLSVPGASPHRSVAMKSFAHPDTGMQTTQVMWTDTVPDPSDPKPGDSSQVTRKTTTRVTTRSGHGDLPQQTTTLLDEPDPNPAFLAPSNSQRTALPPAALTPSASNVHYYTGQRSAPVEPAPVEPPPVIHEAPNRSRAVRDTITFGESSDV